MSKKIASSCLSEIRSGDEKGQNLPSKECQDLVNEMLGRCNKDVCGYDNGREEFPGHYPIGFYGIDGKEQYRICQR